MLTVSNPVLQHFQKVRQLSVDFCKPLKTEDYIPQPVTYISPAKWHLGHTSWFFEELVLKRFKPDYQEYDPDFSFLFNSYYNSLGDRILRCDRGNMTRPSVNEVYDYRNYIDEQMASLIQQQSGNEEMEKIIILGLNHEQQHQELMVTDLKYILGHHPLFPPYKEGHSFGQKNKGQQRWISLSEGLYEIGFEGNGFHYDNELGRHKVFLHDFEISNHLITNGEFLEFIQDGGYEKFEYWLDEGWAWVKEEGIKAPMYWHFHQGEWKQYTLGGLKTVNSAEILFHISFYEAAAFAEWKNMRLPTEFEWEAAADLFDWGTNWEWTYSAYLPYPGFTKVEGPIGEYNGKFMINQMVLRGASVATSPQHSRKSYRNFFHPQLRWQYTGIRLVKK